MSIRDNDRVLRGAGVFDTMLVVIEKNKIHLAHADEHFARLKHDAGVMGIEFNDDLESAAMALIEVSDLTPGRYALNTTITGGAAERGLATPEKQTPQTLMRLSALPDEFPPIHAIISKTVRRNEHSPLSRIKSVNYGDNILALNEARAKGANEAIMLNTAGNIACTTIGNLFISRNGKLFTPPVSDGALPGITRGLLLARHGAVEKTIMVEELDAADGLFITNALRGLNPVLKLNGQDINPVVPSVPKDFYL